MGAPVGGVHHGALGGEMLRQVHGARTAGGGHGEGHAGTGDRLGPIHRTGPADAGDAHQQGRDHTPEDQLTLVLPVARQQAQHEQSETEQGGEDAEGADGLDLEQHHRHQHQAEHGHASGEQEEGPAAAGEQFTAQVALEHQGQQGKQQHGRVGQEAEQGEGLAEEGAPDTVEHLVAGFGSTGADQGTEHPPALEGDGTGVEGTDGGQHRHHHPDPAAAWIGATALAEAASQLGGGHGGRSSASILAVSRQNGSRRPPSGGCPEPPGPALP